jgi:uncharacterized protein (DUF1800 family)
MLLWLDNQENVKGKPNENYAREVMELFTLGVGNYTEKDVLEAARAFTGWTSQKLPREEALAKNRQAEFVFRANRHDAGEKTVLGHTGNLKGDDVLDLLCDNQRTSEYLTEKIWAWFVSPNPTPAVVRRHAKVFRDSDLNIKALLRSIMLSEEFSAPTSRRAIVKSPVDFCVATFRQLGVGASLRKLARDMGQGGMLPRTSMAPAVTLRDAMKSMGMWLMYPPDVDGWAGGDAWITSATMVERMKFSEKTLPRSTMANLFPVLTPEAMAKKLVSVLDAPLSQKKIAALIQAGEKASNGKVSNRNMPATAIAICRLMFASPEFQFS